jgi:CRISPR-associated protein Cmr2
VAAGKPSWAKKGEHLGALPAIKRLWPTIFAEEMGRALNPRDDGSARRLDRFVVSTHTMALASQLDRWLEKGGHTAPGLDAECRKHSAEAVASAAGTDAAPQEQPGRARRCQAHPRPAGSGAGRRR